MTHFFHSAFFKACLQYFVSYILSILLIIAYGAALYPYSGIDSPLEIFIGYLDYFFLVLPPAIIYIMIFSRKNISLHCYLVTFLYWYFFDNGLIRNRWEEVLLLTILTVSIILFIQLLILKTIESVRSLKKTYKQIAIIILFSLFVLTNSLSVINLYLLGTNNKSFSIGYLENTNKGIIYTKRYYNYSLSEQFYIKALLENPFCIPTWYLFIGNKYTQIHLKAMTID